jgi:hypothetical protein
MGVQTGSVYKSACDLFVLPAGHEATDPALLRKYDEAHTNSQVAPGPMPLQFEVSIPQGSVTLGSAHCTIFAQPSKI